MPPPAVIAAAYTIFAHKEARIATKSRTIYCVTDIRRLGNPGKNVTTTWHVDASGMHQPHRTPVTTCPTSPDFE
jgi:hypothetical protein